LKPHVIDPFPRGEEQLVDDAKMRRWTRSVKLSVVNLVAAFLTGINLLFRRSRIRVARRDTALVEDAGGVVCTVASEGLVRAEEFLSNLSRLRCSCVPLDPSEGEQPQSLDEQAALGLKDKIP
jgi:hypothetical protein